MKKELVGLTGKLEVLFQQTEQENPKAKDDLVTFLQQIDMFEKNNKKEDDC
ncbi:hypothetical protein [Bacillus sp. C30]|uniref:hypothetical protein n=1 Tax=Bacillus sp. C30 TaxID=1387733 RepID=UPI00349F0894